MSTLFSDKIEASSSVNGTFSKVIVVFERSSVCLKPSSKVDTVHKKVLRIEQLTPLWFTEESGKTTTSRIPKPLNRGDAMASRETFQSPALNSSSCRTVIVTGFTTTIGEDGSESSSIVPTFFVVKVRGNALNMLSTMELGVVVACTVESIKMAGSSVSLG